MPKQHLTNDTWFMIQYAFVILVFLLLLWLLSRWIVRMGQSKQQGSNIQVVEAVRVGQDSFVYIVRVVDKYYVISQNKHALLHLDTLDEVEQRENLPDFAAFLGKMRSLRKKESAVREQLQAGEALDKALDGSSDESSDESSEITL